MSLKKTLAIKSINTITKLLWIELIALCIYFAASIEVGRAWRMSAITLFCLVAGASFSQISVGKWFVLRDLLRALISMLSTVGLMIAFSLIQSDRDNALFGMVFVVFALILIASIAAIFFQNAAKQYMD